MLLKTLSPKSIKINFLKQIHCVWFTEKSMIKNLNNLHCRCSHDKILQCCVDWWLHHLIIDFCFWNFNQSERRYKNTVFWLDVTNFYKKIQIFTRKSKFLQENPNFYKKIQIFARKSKFLQENPNFYKKI